MLQHEDRPARRRARSIRLSDAEVEELLDELDRREGSRPRQLAPPLYSYRIADLHLDLAVSSNSWTPYRVPTRWLSEEALGCLHGSFVHTGTEARAVLITPYGTWHDQEGRVARCVHVGGHVHELNIRFTHPIDLSYFCLAAGTCRVLLVEDDKLVARMISAWFQQYNAEVDHVESAEAGIERVRQTQYDVIMLDMVLPDRPGWELAREVRAGGFSGRIVAMSAMDTPQTQRQAFDAGCDQFVAKPFDRTFVGELVRSLREEPILSNLHDDPTMAEFLLAFATGLPVHCRRIRKAVSQRDIQALSAEVRMLKAQGGICGYDVIAGAAAQVETALEQGAAGEDLCRRLNELLRLCSRVRAPAGKGGSSESSKPAPTKVQSEAKRPASGG